MVRLNPARVGGHWDEGFTLDRHIESSDYIGDNEYGHPQFETKRTELGELIFRLKYRGDQTAVSTIAEAASDFVKEWKPGIDLVVTVPPSKGRKVQPLFQIADEVGRLLNVPVDKESVYKSKATPELKNVERAKRLELILGAHSTKGDALRGRRILLLDDLYQTGATLNAIGRLLKESGGVSAVFVLALTRARG